MLEKENVILALIDVQGRLAQLMHDRDDLFDNLCRLIRGVQVLGIPILWVEQIPDKLGSTIDPVARLLTDQQPIAKSCFSCLRSEPFREALTTSGRRQVLLSGIETHICVYQTAMSLLENGYEAQVVADATSSRTALNKQIGLQRIQGAGGWITSTEMALFEMLQAAEGQAFRDMIPIVK